MFRVLKCVLGQRKVRGIVFLCNKVSYNKVLLWIPVLYLYYFWICVCLHMLCMKVYRKTSVGETHREDLTRIDRESHNSGSNGPRTALAKVGPRRARERAAQPPTWAARPTTAPPRLVLCPQLGMSPIHSIFICFAFRFEPNWKSINK